MDPDTARFISEDPSKKGGNWFSYCENDPINLIDTSGKEPNAILSAIGDFGRGVLKEWGGGWAGGQVLGVGNLFGPLGNIAVGGVVFFWWRKRLCTRNRKVIFEEVL